MEWGEAKRMTNGTKGFYQETLPPHKYCISYVQSGEDRGVFSAVDGKGEAFARFWLDQPDNRDLIRETARAMRVCCAIHAASHQPGKGRLASD